MRLSLVLVTLVSLGLIACTDDGPTLLVIINADDAIGVPDDINEIRVDATASRRESAYLCEPIDWSTSLMSRSDLPLELLFHRGESYGEWLAIRLRAFSDDDLLMRLVTVRAWHSEGHRELELTLEATCLGELCDDDLSEQCLDGWCQNAPLDFEDEDENWFEDCDPQR